MVVKIVEPSYSYLGGPLVSFNGTVQLLADDGVTVLYQTGISVKGNLQDANWKDKMETEAAQAAQDVVNNYKNIMGIVAQAFPTAASPGEAAQQFATDVEGKVVV